MRIHGEETIIFNRLRAITGPDGVTPFGFQIAPKLATTDFVGEYMIAGGPKLDGITSWSRSAAGQAGGNATSANDGADAYSTGFDGIAKTVHQRPIFVPHQNILGGTGYDPGHGRVSASPTVWWDNYQSPDDHATHFAYKRAPLNYYGLRWESSDVVFGDAGSGSAFSIVGSSNVAAQGFTAYLAALPAWKMGTAQSYASIMWRVAGSASTSHRWYAVILYTGAHPQFVYNDHNDSNGLPVPGYWIIADAVKIGANGANLVNGGQYAPADPNDRMAAATTNDLFPLPPDNVVSVRLAAGQMQVKLNDDKTPFVWPQDLRDTDGNPEWCIDRYIVSGFQLSTFDWSVHLTKFEATAQIVSLEQQLSFTPTETQLSGMTSRIHCLPNVGASSSLFDSSKPGFIPPSSTVTAVYYDITGGSLVRYLLTITSPSAGSYQGVSFSNFSPMVYAVTLIFPGETQVITWTPVVLGSGINGAPPVPLSVDVRSTFDINTLSARSSASMTFSNFKGEWTNGSNTGWLDALGVWGAQIELGSQGLNDDGSVMTGFEGGVHRVFTGLANMDFVNEWRRNGQDTVTVSFDDFWTTLDVPIWDLKFFDAMNAYYVMYEIAQLAGLTASQMGFMDYVPDDPYSPSPGLSSAEQLYLPAAPSGTPTTRFAPGTKARDMMLRISYSLGMALRFDQYGVLQFQVWMPNDGWNAPADILYSGYAGLATNDLATCGLDPGADEVLDGVFSGSLRETRSSVLVMGPRVLGTSYDVVSSADENIDMILHDGWDTTPIANYLGFRSRVVWTDIIFMDQQYSDDARSQMLNFLSIPDREIQIRVYDKPGTPIFPGYLIRVMYQRSGSTGFTMFVTSVAYHHAQGTWPTVSVTARIIPPGWSPFTPS